MTEPPTGSGALPLQEYRREIPPGWVPGDPSYPLRLYFDRLRLWYRVTNLDDEIIGPLLAGRLYGKAGKIALALKVPRPDGTYDTGDAALSRLAVDEVRDPTTGALLQEHIPSGVQYLTDALKNAFGQMDQDLATQALERFFSCSRGKMSLAEYSVEFETRLDEASDRAGLSLNNVGRFYLFFRGSGLATKTIDDIKLQVGGDYNRFQDARQLALRLSPNRHMENAEVFYEDAWNYDDEVYYGDYDDWYDADDEPWWSYYEDEGWYGEDYGDDPWHECYEDEEAWNYEPPAEQGGQDAKTNEEQAKDDTSGAGEYYGKGGKNNNQEGCFNCGSKWHVVKDCPLTRKTSKGKGKSSSYWKGKGYGGKSKSKGWPWRPFSKGNFKGKKGYGKSKSGKKGFNRFGKGSWFTASSSTDDASAVPVLMTSKGLNISDGIPDETTKTRQMSHNAKEYVIHTSSEEQEEVLKLGRSSNQDKHHDTSSTDKTEEDGACSTTSKKAHSVAFSFASSFYDINEYFVVRGEKRRGLLIDPGAASGLIGSETLRDLLATCVIPYGKEDNYEIRFDKTSPVSGINGASDRTLGQVTVPLQTSGHAISYTGEILGGQGSLCPALVGNPALRSMNSVLFTNYFQNGDGLLSTDYISEKDGEEVKRFKLFRLLLTESGHYLLPTDEPNTKTKLPDGTRQEVVAFYTKVVEESVRLWNDVSEKMTHCFFGESTRAAQTEGDRGDDVQLCDEVEESGDGKDESSVTEHAELPKTLNPNSDNKDMSAQEDSHGGILPEPQFSNDTHNEEKPCEKFHLQEAQFWLSEEESFPRYKEDQIPENMDRGKMEKRYRAIPEEFYSKSGFRPITPANFPKWFQRARNRGLKWHFWEICSGSGRLSLTLLLAGLVIGPPIDARYGWDLNNYGHQRYLNMARNEFAPGVIHCSPDCAPWSISSNTKDPELRHLERLRDQPALEWTQKTCEYQDAHERGYSLEQPWGSAMTKNDTESPLRLEKIPGNRPKQRVDQCMHEARDERGWLIQKATGLSANFKFGKTALRCSGHNGQRHSHLQGQAPNGLSRTSMSAVYPKTMCQRMRMDIIRFLEQKKLLHIKAWPMELSWFSSQHFYECVRCTLGRACPKGIEHTMVPGQCRHGKWASGTDPETKGDPVKKWKTTTNKETMEQVIIKNHSNIELTVERSHWLKKMLMETVQNALGLFNEASNRMVDYDHWVNNAVMMSLFKEVFDQHMEVKAVKISLRPFHKAPPDPQVVTSTAYLRLHIIGNIKEWTIQNVEDLREMSHNQIHADLDVEHWMVTVYGQDLGTVPAPSTPTSRPRSIPPQPELPPRRDDAALLPQVRERPEDPAEQEAIQDAPYEEFDSQDRKDLDIIRPIKPNYNIRRVLHKLPSLVSNGDITRAKQLLLGLHERLWHTPVSDFVSLLRRAGMPTEVLEQARDAVAGCAVCRKYIRLPNRPQTRTGGAHIFNEAIQIDLFNLDSTWFLLMLDEATRFKTCSVVEGQEADQLLSCLLKSWIYMFGPPHKIIMDQQCSLMGHEVAVEFERLGMARVPKGTTAGQGAEQHTGTGLVERHVQLLKLTMLKLRAELARQGLTHEPQDLCQESAMAHNITLNYGGATPSMAVFGMLPRGFYELDSDGVMTTAGSVQTDVTPFERAIRIRQTALAQTQQAIAEDRIARASRTRPHQLKLGEMTWHIRGGVLP